MPKLSPTLVVMVVAALVLLVFYGLFQPTAPAPTAQYIAYSDFVRQADAGRVSDVAIQGSTLRGTLRNNEAFQTYLPEDPALVRRLIDKDVRVLALPKDDRSLPLAVLLQ